MPRPAKVLTSLATFAMLFAICVTWSLATARYGGPDEPAHVLRAAAVADGQLTGDPAPDLAPGYRFVTVPAELATGDPACYRHDAQLAATCAVARAGSARTRRAATSAALYPPLYYAAVGIPVRALADTAATMPYRVVAAAWCALVLALALHRARRLAGQRHVVVLASLSPAAWFLFGVVNPNSIEVALALLAWVGVARLLRDGPSSRRDVAWVSVPMAIAIALRPVAALAWAVMLAVLAVGWISRRRRPANLATLLARMLAGPLVALGSVAVWSRWRGLVVSDERTARTVLVLRALQLSWDNTSDTLREAAGSLGWLEFSAPNAAQALWWAIVVAATAAIVRRPGPLRRAWVVIAVAVVAVPVVFEVALAGDIGFIWQGRYSIPVVVGVVVLAAPAWQGRARWCAVVLGAAVVADVLTFWTVLRRYAVGSEGSWLFSRAGWRPPINLWSLLAIHTTLVASAYAASVRRFGHLAAHDVERRAGTEPLDLFEAERVDSLEVDA